MHPLPRLLTVATAVLVAAGPARAQDTQPAPEPPVYRCGGAHATYSNVPCGPHSEPLGTKRISRTFDRHAPPPQDRARQMQRAALDADTRQQCDALQSHIRADELRLRSKGTMPTEAEEGDLAILRVRYRELRC